MNYQTLTINFERELLLQLIANMRKGVIQKDKAKVIAQVFLGILKEEKTKEEFMENMYKVAPYYTELREACLKVAATYENENTEDALKNVRENFKQITN